MADLHVVIVSTVATGQVRRRHFLSPRAAADYCKKFAPAGMKGRGYRVERMTRHSSDLSLAELDNVVREWRRSDAP